MEARVEGPFKHPDDWSAYVGHCPVGDYSTKPTGSASRARRQVNDHIREKHGGSDDED